MIRLLLSSILVFVVVGCGVGGAADRPAPATGERASVALLNMPKNFDGKQWHGIAFPALFERGDEVRVNSYWGVQILEVTVDGLSIASEPQQRRAERGTNSAFRVPKTVRYHYELRLHPDKIDGEEAWRLECRGEQFNTIWPVQYRIPADCKELGLRYRVYRNGQWFEQLPLLLIWSPTRWSTQQAQEEAAPDAVTASYATKPFRGP